MNSVEKMDKIRRVFEKLADETLTNSLVEYVQAELRGNLNVSDKGLPAYGISKVAHISAQMSAAIALRINPNILRFSYEASEAEINRTYETLADADYVPTEV